MSPLEERWLHGPDGPHDGHLVNYSNGGWKFYCFRCNFEVFGVPVRTPEFGRRMLEVHWEHACEPDLCHASH